VDDLQIVLLHPLPLDGSMWPDEMQSLGGRTITPTLYDYGDSIGNWARGVLDQTRPGPLVVVGNSVGGSCAIEIARLAPDRVRLLVLVGAKAGHRREPSLRDQAVRLLGQQDIDAAWNAYWAPLFGPDTDPAVVERGRTIAHEQGVASLIRGVQVFHDRPDRASFLREYDGRVVVVSGEHDIHPDRAHRAASQLRNAAFVCVPAVGHYLPLEQPHALATIVRSETERLPPRTSSVPRAG